MKRALSIALFAELLLSAASCNPFEPDQTVVLAVSKIDAPSTVVAGTPFDVVLTVDTGGCRSFERMDVVRSQMGVSFTVWGKDGSKGRSDVTCPDNLILEPHTYQVKPPFSGPFNIYVNRGRLSPLTATVQVQ